MSLSRRHPRRTDGQVVQPKLPIRRSLIQDQSERGEVLEAFRRADLVCCLLSLISVEIRDDEDLWSRIFDGTRTLGGSWGVGRRLDCDLEMCSLGGGSGAPG